jgi:hypothetical protein
MMATRRMHLVKMIIYIKALKASDSKVRHKIGTADVAGREGGREGGRQGGREAARGRCEPRNI